MAEFSGLEVLELVLWVRGVPGQVAPEREVWEPEVQPPEVLELGALLGEL